MLLPLGDLVPSDPPPRAPPAVQASPPPVTTPRRGRAPQPPEAPNPHAWADQALQRIQLRQGEVTESLGEAVDLLTRQLDAGIARLEETARLSREELASLKAWIEEQTTAFRLAMAELVKQLTADTREASSNIAVARHELALSVAQLRRRTYRHGITLGAATALLILFAARLLFPFWGMDRQDVTAWNRGTRLLESYQRASPARKTAILQALQWQAMPDAADPLSAWSGSPEAGR